MAPPPPASGVTGSSNVTGPSSAGKVVRLGFNPHRLRQWLNRLPFFTRIVLLIVVVVQLVSLFVLSLPMKGALIPSQISLLAAHRLNTFPFVHTGIIQTIFSLVALIPLLERFESEHGTLVSIALFIGPFSTLPGLIYIIIDHLILRLDNMIMGASIWVFLLLACEAVKQGRAHPSVNIGGVQIPTWATTIVVILFLNFLIPNTSLLGHLCGALIGYGFELGVLKFLVPPERILRWIEGRLNLLGRLPHYVSVDQKTYGRYGVLPTREGSEGQARTFLAGSTQRLGP